MTKNGKILTKECYLPTTLLFLTHDCDTVASMPPALPHHHLADQYQYAWKKHVIDWVMSQSGTGEWWPWPQPPLVLPLLTSRWVRLPVVLMLAPTLRWNQFWPGKRATLWPSWPTTRHHGHGYPQVNVCWCWPQESPKYHKTTIPW